MTMVVAPPDIHQGRFGWPEGAMIESPGVLFQAWTEQFDSPVCGTGIGIDESRDQRGLLLRSAFRGRAASALWAIPWARLSQIRLHGN